MTSTRNDSLNTIREILSESENSVSESHLALTGDKQFFLSDSGRSFIMYGVKGRNWIALGTAIGVRSEFPSLILNFMRAAREANKSPAFYGVRERHLPIFDTCFGAKSNIAMLKCQKIGEMALVPIASFTLSGKDKARFRQAKNRAERSGLSFKILVPSETVSFMDELAAISTDWLAQQQGREKGFSLGRFDRAVLSRQPIAVAMKDNAIIAFSNLWSSPDKTELSLDLMRYKNEVMPGVIDYLLVETMSWGHAQGYQFFSLGMAPLAGLDSKDHRSVMSYLCRLAFKHGDKMYGFQGIRQFKKKFNPEWEAVYLLAPSQLHMPIALKNLAVLSAGSLAGIIRRSEE